LQVVLRGDVFQIVLSRRYQQKFIGDEFNVYRALRSVNPSPYLFYFDYGDYKLMGSSPESQLIIKNGKQSYTRLQALSNVQAMMKKMNNLQKLY
jgi:anthranilate synthase component 1